MTDFSTAAGLVGQGILFGLAAAVPLGPVNVEMARRTLRGGFAAGAAVGFGAVTVDVLLAGASVLLLTVGGGRTLGDHPAAYWALKLAGAGLLIYLGTASLRSAWRARKGSAVSAIAVSDSTSQPSARRGYATGLLLNGLNPVVWSVWFVVLPAVAAGPANAAGASGLTAGSVGGNLPMLCAGVFLSTSAWVVAFAGALSRGRRMAVVPAALRHRGVAAVDLFGGLTLLGFAAATVAGPVLQALRRGA